MAYKTKKPVKKPTNGPMMKGPMPKSPAEMKSVMKGMM
jgi:hypothetical protein